MKEKLYNILKSHSEAILKLNTDKSITKLVKEIDLITQETCGAIYALRTDINLNKTESIVSTKKGHCC